MSPSQGLSRSWATRQAGETKGDTGDRGDILVVSLVQSQDRGTSKLHTCDTSPATREPRERRWGGAPPAQPPLEEWGVCRAPPARPGPLSPGDSEDSMESAELRAIILP